MTKPVYRDMDKDDMAAYSQALLDCSFPRKRIAACPLAFGEVGVKERVKNILNYRKPAFWIVMIAVAVFAVLAVCLMTDPKRGKADPGAKSEGETRPAYTETGTDIDMERLRTKYSEYFDLDTAKGLEVYVWQMTPRSYSCGVLPGSDREMTFDELIKLKGASIAEMRAILSAYDVAEEDVSVIPWQNPISSYLPEYWISLKGETPAEAEKRRDGYIAGIRDMLFRTT